MSRYLSVCLLGILSLVKGWTSNCVSGSECDACGAGRFWMVQQGTTQVKVCSPKCLKTCYAGNDYWDGSPFCNCIDVSDITGDCWKGDQCDPCLAGPNKIRVGSINGLSLCCPNCERSGVGLFNMTCKCLHNGR